MLDQICLRRGHLTGCLISPFPGYIKYRWPSSSDRFIDQVQDQMKDRSFSSTYSLLPVIPEGKGGGNEWPLPALTGKIKGLVGQPGSPEIFILPHNSLVHTNMVQKQCVFQVMISQRIISFALINYS